MSDLYPNWFSDIASQKGMKLAGSILRATFLAWIPAQLICLAVQEIHPGPTMDAAYFSTPLRAITLTLMVAPVLETYMMRGIFWVGGKVMESSTILNLLSAIVWGAMHWRSESWGLHAVWSFYVMGLCFLRLKARSMQAALYVTMIIHLLFNALSYLVVSLG